MDGLRALLRQFFHGGGEAFAEFFRALGELGDDQALATGFHRHRPVGFIETYRIDIRQPPLETRSLGGQHGKVAPVQSEFRRG